MKEIDAFIEKFAPHGYEYFVIDNGWFAYPPSEKYKGYLMPVSGKVEVYAVWHSNAFKALFPQWPKTHD